MGLVSRDEARHGNPALYLMSARLNVSLGDMTKSNNGKFIFMPGETSSMLASVGAVKEMIAETGSTKHSADASPPPPRQLRQCSERGRRRPRRARRATSHSLHGKPFERLRRSPGAGARVPTHC